MGFIQVGILAITAFGLLIIVGLRPVRKAAYELFFFLHFAMALCVHFLPLRTPSLTRVHLVFSSLVVTSTPRRRGEQCPTHL